MDKVKRVAFLSHIDINLYLFRLHIMKTLAKKGWEVFAVIPEGKYAEEFPKYGIKTKFYKLSRKSINPVRELKLIFDLQKIIKDTRPLILHTYVVKSNIYGSIAAKMEHIPIVINSITGLGSFYIENTKKAKIIRNIIEFLYKFAFSYSKKVIFQNPDDLHYFINKEIIPTEKAYLIRGSGVDTEHFLFSIKSPSTTFRVILISRLIKHKGIIEFCEVAKILKQKYKNIKFTLVGEFYDGNPSSISKDYIYNLSASGVIEFLGWREDIYDLISDSDLLVLPSYREGLPNTLLEAMSIGRPIVVADTVGCKEVVDDKINGLKVRPKDITNLKDAIEVFYKNKVFSRKAGYYGRTKAKIEFSKDKIVNMHIKLYENFINTK